MFQTVPERYRCRASEIVEAPRQRAEHFSRPANAVRTDVLERPRDRLFNREPASARETDSGRFEAQSCAAAVAWIATALEQAAIRQPLKNPGHRAGMQPHDLRQVPR